MSCIRSVAFAGVLLGCFAVAQDRESGRSSESFESRFERRFAEESAKLRQRLLEEFSAQGVREEPPAAERLRRRAAELEKRVAELEKENAALERKLAAAEREGNARRRSAGRREGDPEAPPTPVPPRSKSDATDPRPKRAVAETSSPEESVDALRRKIADLRRRGAPEDLLRTLEAELEAAAKGELPAERAAVPSPGGPGELRQAPAVRKAGARSFLGVVPGNVSSEWRKRNGVPDGAGVRVAEVVAESPAARAGLKADDVLLSLDGAEVRGEEDLRAKLKASGGRVRIAFRRGGATLESTAELGSPPDERHEDPAFRKLYDDTLKKVIEEGSPSLPTGAPSSPGGG